MGIASYNQVVRKPKLMKRLLTLFVALPLVLALTSCVRFKMHIDIGEDNTLTGVADMGMDKNLVELSGEYATPEEFCIGMDWHPDEDDVTPYDDGSYFGCEMKSPVGYLSEVSEDSPIQQVGDEIHFNWSAAELSEADDQGVDASYFSEFEISVTFPGEVLTHNGSSTVAGTTVTWTDANDFFTDEGLQATAKASGAGTETGDKKSEDSGLPLWAWIAIGGGGVVVVGLVVALTLGSRKKRAKAAAQAQQYGSAQQHDQLEFGQLDQQYGQLYDQGQAYDYDQHYDLEEFFGRPKDQAQEHSQQPEQNPNGLVDPSNPPNSD